MKKFWHLLAGLLLILTSATFTSCVDGDFEEPPITIPTVDFEANTTIADLKASYTSFRMIEDDIIISGIVVANDESGNLYKKMVIQDETAGIELSLDKAYLYNEFKLGQRVLVKCKGMYLGDYNQLIQLGYIYNGSIGRLPETFISAHLFRDSLPGAKPVADTIALDQLVKSRVSTLVAFKNVRFEAIGELFAPQTVDNTNRTLMDASGNKIEVRTSKYSNFSGDTIPNGYGTVTGILSIFQTTWQLTLRDINDLSDFGGSGPPPPPPGGGTGTKEDPYDVPKARNLQGQDISGWVKGFIIGSVKTGVTSVTSASDFDFAAPFSSATNVLLAPSKDETDYNNCIIVNLPAGSPLRTAVNLLDNPENLKKELNVLGTLRTYFGIAGLRDCPGQEGDFELEGGVTPPPPGSGSGTFEDPYDVARALTTTGTDPVWVEGYIVGNIEVGTENVPNFAGPFVTNTNLLIAGSAEETNPANCMPVQLPSGAIREALNLVTTPGNKGKIVKVLGTLENYFSQPGVKNLTGYWLDGNGIIPATGFFTEEFNQTLGSFTEYSVLGDQKWFGDTYDGGCVTMTGYVAPNYFANEDWLISPVISLAGKTGVELMFREAVNFVNNMDDVKVLISTDYSGNGDPSEASWTELSGFTRSAGNSWTFANTSQISLANWEGDDIRIAFKYISTTSKAGTWEISRVVVSSN